MLLSWLMSVGWVSCVAFVGVPSVSGVLVVLVVLAFVGVLVCCWMDCVLGGCVGALL